jgi:dephospho-CoA kinase
VRIIGLTGGIASGKSTVSAMLRELGAHLLDADVIAREVVEPGTPGLEDVGRRFPGVIGPDGRLDRQALGARIFANPEERSALNALLHPRIQQAFLEKTQALAEGGAEVVVYDAPLLIENRLHEWMNGVILVYVPREVQVRRLMARNGLDRAQAEERLAAQLPLDDKRQHATWIVDNSEELARTRAQVEDVWRSIQSGR